MNTTPQKHHEFSPSKLELLAQCPASWRMSQGLTEEPSEASEEGSLLHWCVAKSILGEKWDAELTQEQGEILDRCVDFANTLTEQCTAYTEMTLEVKDGEDVLTEGTADLVVWNDEEKKLIVCDWKFGRNPVTEASQNLQIATYALGAMQKFGSCACEAHIFQPRIGAHTSYTFQRAEAILRNIRGVINNCKSDSVLSMCVGDHCRYCLARHNCPALSNRLHAVATTRETALQDPKNCYRLYKASRAVKSFIDDVETAFKEHLAKLGDIGGYELKECAGRKECQDIQGLASGLKEWFSPKEFLGFCNISVSAVVSSLTDRIALCKKIKKADAKKEAEEMLAPYVTQGKGFAKIAKVEK